MTLTRELQRSSVRVELGAIARQQRRSASALAVPWVGHKLHHTL